MSVEDDQVLARVVYVKYVLLGEEPVSVWIAVVEPRRRLPIDDDGPVFDAFAEGCYFRGVSLDRLPSILRFGIDVQPTDSPIYAGDFEKAWEYGDFPKVVMALDPSRTESTCHVIDDDLPQVEIDELKVVYPHVHKVDGQTWLSRISHTNPTLRGYEAAYGRWIPGDPFETLRAIFVYVSPGNLKLIAQMIK
ncbi:hypothetical protein BJF90_07225 [Pseudonocardia sp. CNS-004]|nr:hypothetical protein BJF90_07225 [Pseudonocardia sp. CNS-004]